MPWITTVALHLARIIVKMKGPMGVKKGSKRWPEYQFWKQTDCPAMLFTLSYASLLKTFQVGMISHLIAVLRITILKHAFSVLTCLSLQLLETSESITCTSLKRLQFLRYSCETLANKISIDACVWVRRR